jgi:hypothetical protein
MKSFLYLVIAVLIGASAIAQNKDYGTGKTYIKHIGVLNMAIPNTGDVLDSTELKKYKPLPIGNYDYVEMMWIVGDKNYYRGKIIKSKKKK